MKVYVVVDCVSGVIDDVQVFDNKEAADQLYNELKTSIGSDKYDVLQFETELQSRQDPMTQRHGYVGVTEEDIEFLAERLGFTDDQRDYLLQNREELSDTVAQDIMEQHWSQLVDDRAKEIIIDMEVAQDIIEQYWDELVDDRAKEMIIDMEDE